MYCDKCNRRLPYDSLFCPYCGNKATNETKALLCTSCSNEIPADSDFCPYCGSTISKEEDKPISNIETSIEANALKQERPLSTEKAVKTYNYENNIHKSKKKAKFNKITAIILALSIISAGLVTLNIIQFINNKELIEQKEKEIQLKESSVERYKDLYEQEQIKNNDLKEKNDRLFDESFFLITEIAIVYDDGSNYYHVFGCDHHSSDSFWAFNNKAAIARGYEKCPYCHRFS